MNSPTLGLYAELIKASTRAMANGYTCEAVAQAMRDYADALMHSPASSPRHSFFHRQNRGAEGHPQTPSLKLSRPT